MNEISSILHNTALAMQQNLPLLLGLILSLWVMHFFNWLLGYRLTLLGIYPRTWHGLMGIIFSPVIHGDFNHVFFNSLPLFILASFILLEGRATFWYVTGEIMLISGLAVWLLGRRAFHVGASGLIMGYWAYILLSAYQEKTFLALLLGFIALYYFGGMIFNLLPGDAKTSWESHIYGFLAGIVAYFIPHDYLSPMTTTMLSI